ncbi:MAG: hypothetical protein HOI23_17085 [Deltaproteobacteria bacterium]|jgi:hypothetical protein|nr:hypothetical protein [Deltaproteobacteria bacterium]MBT6435008.1 hypothetical protein [Deltaproteobacteria bacterium]MBT6491788.1 hypothetical protein [Deltaproteobacteria bacterium]
MRLASAHVATETRALPVAPQSTLPGVASQASEPSFRAANDSFERVGRINYRSTNGFGTEQLQVIADGAPQPIRGEWIYASDVKPALALIDSILSGDTSLSVEETTKPWFCGLFFKRCPGFREAIRGDLLKLSRSPLGRQLLREIAEHTKPVVIRPTTSTKGGLVEPLNESKARRTPRKQGEGSGSVVHIPNDLKDDTFVVYRSPGFDYDTGRMRSGMDPSTDDEIAQPRFIILGHELVHVYRAQRGQLTPKGYHRRDAYHNQEEFETIAGESRFTENRLRRAHGLPNRYGHFHHRQ